MVELKVSLAMIVGICVTVSGCGGGGGHGRPTVPQPAPSSRVTLNGPLPSGPSHATAWTLPDGPADRQTVRRLALALGLTGVPREHGASWTASGPGVLEVSGTADQRWSYS